MDETEGQESQEEAQELAKSEDGWQKEKKDLLSEIHSLRDRARKSDAERLQAKFGVEVSPDDLKGLDVAKVEALLAQVAKPGEKPSETKESPQPNSLAVDAATRTSKLQDTNEALSSGVTTGRESKYDISSKEALAKTKSGEWGETDYRDFVEHKRQLEQKSGGP